uniref:Photolyase/cryptochrome alpha/beta domain-containing protein n=2 Tax=Chrysotila carterae TaxID=13221 RepID=A0A7S4BWL8_CHRCT
MQFLLESLEDLDRSLRALNSRLIVLRGSPLEQLELAFERWQINQIAYEIDTEPYAKERDAAVCKMAQKTKVKVLRRFGHTLCNVDALLRRADGKPVTSYSAFLTNFNKEVNANPIVVLDPPAKLPPPKLEDAGIHREHCGGNTKNIVEDAGRHEEIVKDASRHDEDCFRRRQTDIT